MVGLAEMADNGWKWPEWLEMTWNTGNAEMQKWKNTEMFKC